MTSALLRKSGEKIASRSPVFGARAVFVSAAMLSLSACNDEPLEPNYPAPSALYDSKTCAKCHPAHYDEWSASMHAYAAEDPVFLAMNQRGQEETNFELGTFCVNCHAPLAVRLGLTDGRDPSQIPAELRGVTCYFCHNVDAVEGTHNNPLSLSDDVTMRGRIKDPETASFHRSSYSALLAGDQHESAAMCGSCHDIVLPTPLAPAPVELERTFTEWKASVFAPEHAPSPSSVSTCTSCHLPGINGVPIAEGGPKRTRHSHHMAAVDGPMTPFPATDDAARDAELAALQASDRERLLDVTVRVEICLQVLTETESAVHVTLDNANAGHNFPSGASQDRRAFTELVAYRGDEVIYQSGVVADAEAVSVETDPDLWLLRDEAFDEAGNEVHMFWDIAELERNTLPAQVTANPALPEYYKSHLRRRFPLASGDAIPGVPDRVTVRLRLVPIGFDVLDDLVESGHLDPTLRNRMTTLDLLPFRRDDFGSEPGLEGLNAVSMEWSAATLASSRFVAREDFTQHPPWNCVAMPRRPR
jgi:hypothetical protein